jgi:hypothetical protein
MGKQTIDWMDVETLACAALGLGDDAGSSEIENALFDKLDVSFDTFHRIVELLAPLTPPARALLSGKEFHGFVKDGVFLVKVETGDGGSTLPSGS